MGLFILIMIGIWIFLRYVDTSGNDVTSAALYAVFCLSYAIMTIILIITLIKGQWDDTSVYFIFGMILTGYLMYRKSKNDDIKLKNEIKREEAQFKWEQERPIREEREREERRKRELDEQKERNQQQQIRKTEEIAMKSSINYETRNERFPKDVSSENLGYDIKSSNNNETRFIEVKGLANDLYSEYILLTSNEWNKAKEMERAYWLYIITNCTGYNQNMYIIQNPYNNLTPQYISEQNKYKISLSSLSNYKV